MKIEGFTLAEVLITLGIIEVVAAITIPTLINNHKSVQLRAQLNKTYSTLLQAVNMIYVDSGRLLREATPIKVHLLRI